MNRTQIRILRFLFILLLLLLAAFLILSSDRIRQKRKKTSDVLLEAEHIPEEDKLTDSMPTIKDATTGPSTDETEESITRKSAELFLDVTGSNPHKSLFQSIRFESAITVDGIGLSNYRSGVRTLFLDGGTLSFEDNDFYSFTEKNGVEHIYRISDYISLRELFTGQSEAARGDWFFLGALETRDYVFVAYDFWDADELTLFVRMDKEGLGVSLVYATLYNELSNTDAFVASNESIFYFYTTYDKKTGAVETSLLQADLDGSKNGILLSLADGYSAHHLTPCKDAILFLITDQKKKTSLVKWEVATGQLIYITEKCLVGDYLYLYQNFAVVGVASSSLVLYDITTGKEVLVSLSAYASQSFGLPVCNDSSLFLQTFPWNEKADTVVLSLDPVSRTMSPITLQKKGLCYVTGITKDSLLAESAGTYVAFPLP